MNDIDPSVFIEAGAVLRHNNTSILPIPFGESAMALTYTLCVDGKNLFMKRLKPQLLDEEVYRSLFRKEYETGSALSHNNIVQYVSLYDEDDDCYLLMEHIQGQTLQQRIASDPLYFTRRNNIDKFVQQLLSVVGYLHKQNTMHCDLKPQNIMLTQVNSDVKIIDLGFCFSNSYTQTAGMTVAYAAPEQLNGYIKDIDRTTDIYCIGKILEYIDMRVRRGLPWQYRRIMKRCMKPEKEKRYSSVQDIQYILSRKWWQLKRTWLTALMVFAAMCFWYTATKAAPEPDYDIQYYGINYRIISPEERTCEAVGYYIVDEAPPNAVIANEVIINGEKYSVVSIADSAFIDSEIRSIHIPESIISIGDYAFSSCDSVSYINIPHSVKYIGKGAFAGMWSVTGVDINADVQVLEDRSFSVLPNIEKIVVPEGIHTLRIDALAGAEKLVEVSLPSTLHTIQRGVFYACHSLESITIPASVTSVGEYVFFDCPALKEIYNLNPIPQPAGPVVKNPEQITLYVPFGAADRYRTADVWGRMNIVELPKQ